jgi:hypothetical protein
MGKIEGRIEVMGRQRRRWKQLWDDLKETEGVSIQLHLENLLCKRLWTCHNTDYGMHEH